MDAKEICESGKVIVNILNKTNAEVRTERRSDRNGREIDVIILPKTVRR